MAINIMADTKKKTTAKKNKDDKPSAARIFFSCIGGIIAAAAVICGVIALTGRNPIDLFSPNHTVTVLTEMPVSASDPTTTTTTVPPTSPPTSYPFTTYGGTTATTGLSNAAATALKQQQAEHIRELLPSKKWKTTLMGYNATITFAKNDTANISVKVLFITESLSAKYYVYDDCTVEIKFSYSGKNYRIKGAAEAVTDNKIVLTTTTGETYSLVAA